MKRTRLQFDFSEEALREFDELQRRSGLRSRAELIRHSIRWFQRTLDAVGQKEGKIIFSDEENGQREVVFPFWKKDRSNLRDIMIETIQ